MTQAIFIGEDVGASHEIGPVLPSAAMPVATANDTIVSVADAMAAITNTDDAFEPVQGAPAKQHERRFAAFGTLQSAARHTRIQSTEE